MGTWDSSNSVCFNGPDGPSWAVGGGGTRGLFTSLNLDPSALSHPFFGWEGSPTKKNYRTKLAPLF